MSLASSPAQARAASIGYLALAYTGKRLPLQVLRSNADHAITTGRWQQRPHP